jgi:hypothetical protein
MEQRDATATRTEVLAGLDPAYLAAKERLTAGKIAQKAIPKRKHGRTNEQLSVIGFGGMVVKVSSWLQP